MNIAKLPELLGNKRVLPGDIPLSRQTVGRRVCEWEVLLHVAWQAKFEAKKFETKKFEA